MKFEYYVEWTARTPGFGRFPKWDCRLLFPPDGSGRSVDFKGKPALPLKSTLRPPHAWAFTTVPSGIAMGIENASGDAYFLILELDQSNIAEIFCGVDSAV